MRYFNDRNPCLIQSLRDGTNLLNGKLMAHGM
jgi:hypothetical protein